MIDFPTSDYVVVSKHNWVKLSSDGYKGIHDFTWQKSQISQNAFECSTLL